MDDIREARFAVDGWGPLIVECLFETGLLGELDAGPVRLVGTPFLRLVEGNCGKGLAADGAVIEGNRLIGVLVLPTAWLRRLFTPVTNSCSMAC